MIQGTENTYPLIYRLVTESNTQITVSTEGMDEPGIECVQLINPGSSVDGEQNTTIDFMTIKFENGREITTTCKLSPQTNPTPHEITFNK